MNKNFSYYMPVSIEFGFGIAKELDQYITGKNIMIISDPFLYENGLAQEIGNSLTDKSVAYFSAIEPNPSCATVDKAAEAAREHQADCIIGLGGGSAMDVSKVVSGLVNDGGSIYDYYSGGTKKFSKRKLELLCIPTTAGTGSEVTNVGVFTNQKTGVKSPMLSDQFWADYAIIDPELTYTLPPKVTASTGMDAFCHAIEAYWNKQSQPISDFLAMDAMKLILENIKTAFDEPDNKTARGNMLEASTIAGVAFSQTRTTGIHALSFSLTADFGVSHGMACALTLPSFINLCAELESTKLQHLVEYLGFSNMYDLANHIEKLMEYMQIPTRLSQVGVTENDIEHIVQRGLSEKIIHLTPVEMNEDVVRNLLKAIL